MGADNDGFAVVLTVNTLDWTITSGTKHEFDTVLGYYNSLTKIDQTHYLNAYAGVGNDGFAVVLTVNTLDWTITSGTKHEFDIAQGYYNSLAQIDSTHYLNTYMGTDSDGFAVVLTVNQFDWTITSGTKHEFDTVYGWYNSLVQIDLTHYLNAYMGTNNHGVAVVLTVDVPAADTTKPTYSNAQTNTTIAGKSCLFSIQYNDDTALNPNGQYIFSTNNTGTWVNDSAINFTATPSWANVTKTLNSSVGLSIGYRWYADDNAGNVNNTEIFTLTTTSADEDCWTETAGKLIIPPGCKYYTNVKEFIIGT